MTSRHDAPPVGVGAVTASAAPALRPSLAAVIVALPAASAVTSPAGDTLATAGADAALLTARPVSTFPAASFSTAVACAVCPTPSDAALSVTDTVATGGGDTTKTIDPAFPSLDAVTVTVPDASARRRPVGETVAIAVFDEVQPTVRPLSTLPDASVSVTTTWTVAPIASVEELAESDTVATGAGVGALTVNVPAPVCPSLVATIDADPALTAVTAPVDETVATSGLALDHVTTRSVKTVPEPSRNVAEACAVWPTMTDDGFSVIETAATGGGGGAETVTDVEAVTPSTCAVIVALPTLSAVTVPVDATVATAAFELDQLMARFVNTAPLASRTTAEICAVSFVSSDRVVGDTATDAAGTSVTAIVADASNPSADARIEVLPNASPVTTPAVLTDAIVLFALDHVTT